jgi:hypothetical protein
LTPLDHWSRWAIGSILVLFAANPFSAPGQATVNQKLTLQPGWNVITFQVLPVSHSPESVLSAAVATDGTGRTLYNSQDPSSPVASIYHMRKSPTGFVLEKFPASASDSPPVPRSVPIPDVSLAQQLTSIEYGEAYFVKAQNIVSDASFSIAGLPPNLGWRLALDVGFNPLGILGALPLNDISVGGGGSQPINVLSMFKQADFQSIVYIARWDARNQRYQYFDPQQPDLADFQVLDLGLGYWVNASQAMLLVPELVVDAPGDQDNPPFANPKPVAGQPWQPGPEDVSIGIPGQPPVFHDQKSQTTIYLARTDDSFSLPLYNRGGGILSWKATLSPYLNSAPNNVNALDRVESVKASLALVRTNSKQLPDIQVQGSTSSEPDGLQIRVHRRNLHPGVYLARMLIESNGTDPSSGQLQKKEFTVVVNVGGMDGRWKGSAIIDTVNGKIVSVPDIDLVLQLYTDGLPGSHLMRGVIDSRESLLWPADGQLLGHFMENPTGGFSNQYSGRFLISGGYTLAPGDQNRFPYGTFPSPASPAQMDSDTGLLYRTNNEGDRFYDGLADRVRLKDDQTQTLVPNFTNPTPRFISREFELTGELSAKDNDGTPVVEGKYSEVIRGLIREPIQLQGTFQLSRESAAAFERRPISILKTYAPPNGRPVSQVAPFGSNANEWVVINHHALIDRIMVVLAHDMNDTDFSATLEGPNGKRVLLHGGEALGPINKVIFDSSNLPIDPLQLLKPPEFSALSTGLGSSANADRRDAALSETIGQYVIRHPRESLLSAFRDSDSYGKWKLTISTKNGAQGNVLGWSLLLYGAPIGSIEGDVLVEGSTDPDRFADVDVHVLGLNAELARAVTNFDRRTGHFVISNLPAIRVDLSATKPGFPAAKIDQLNCPDDPRGYHDNFFGIIPGESILTNPPQGAIKLIIREEGDRPCAQ